MLPLRVVYLAIFVVSVKIQEIRRFSLYFYLLAANLFIAMKDHLNVWCKIEIRCQFAKGNDFLKNNREAEAQ